MHQWIQNNTSLAQWIDAHTNHDAIYLDTEFMRTNTFRAQLALVQVNIDSDIALLDAPVLGTHAALAANLRIPDRVCVMHSASEDLEALATIVPQGPARLFDTQIAAAMVGLGFGLSYQKLVALLLNVDVAKAETRSDWLQRPLRPEQLEYAAQDVVHLPQLHAALAKQLAELGRSDWLAEDSQRLIDRSCNTPPDMQPQRVFRAAADWPRERQALLRRVLLWRDASARTQDKPRPWILDDAHALKLVAQPPADSNELYERSKGLRALRAPLRQQLFDVLHAPVQSEELDFAPIPPALGSAEKRLLSAMREDVAAIAAKLDLPEGLLCARRHLETLVIDGAWPAALEGWRKPLLEDALTARLRSAA